ncbi:MAG TPA: hypothetical protein VGJ63_15460 [Micromonosporaceae bacterium]
MATTATIVGHLSLTIRAGIGRHSGRGIMTERSDRPFPLPVPDGVDTALIETLHRLVDRAERGDLPHHAWRTIQWLATDPNQEAIQRVIAAHENRRVDGSVGGSAGHHAA